MYKVKAFLLETLEMFRICTGRKLCVVGVVLICVATPNMHILGEKRLVHKSTVNAAEAKICTLLNQDW